MLVITNIVFFLQRTDFFQQEKKRLSDSIWIAQKLVIFLAHLCELRKDS